MSEVTDWYPASVKPVRVGLYECYRREFPGFRMRLLLWNGNEWRYGKDAGPFNFEGDFACLEILDGDKWRGLKEPA